jgi:hypothetical protein
MKWIDDEVIYRMRFIERKYFTPKSKLPDANIKFENYLSVVAIVYNEGRFLEEWLEYHI